MFRVANYAQFQLSLSHMNRTQTNLAESQIQIASGKKAQNYSDISLNTSELVNMERSLARTEQFSDNISRVLSRLDIMESTTSIIVDRATEVLGIISQGLSGENIDDLPLQQFSTTFSEEIASLLNKQHDNRYLFAGTRTDVPPVDLTDVAYTPQAGLPGTFTADSNYYQGDNIDLSVRVDEDHQNTYGIRANETAFEELLRALSYMDYAGANSDKTVLAEAMRLTRSAVDGLSEIRGRIGANSLVLEQAKISHEDFVTIAMNEISGLEDVDLAEATTILSRNEVQLQASFLSMSRIRSLNLLNYLN